MIKKYICMRNHLYAHKACELVVLSLEQVGKTPFRCTSHEEKTETFES